MGYTCNAYTIDVATACASNWRIHKLDIRSLIADSRMSQPLVNSLNSAFQLDSVLLILGMIGLTYSIVKRDLFILLWVLPSSYFYME